MTFQFERKGKVGTLTLTGSLTVERAEELRSTLLESREKVQHVVVKPLDVDAVDLTCFQILCSAHRLFVAEKKELSLSSEMDEVFREMIRRSGFTRVKACGLDLDSKCIWKRGDD